MTFTITADGAFDTIKDRILLNYLNKTASPISFKTYNISNGLEFECLPQFTFTTDGTNNPVRPIVTKFRLMNNGTEIFYITREQLRAFFKFVQNNTYDNYREVKGNNLWRTIYKVNLKNFDTWDSKTGTSGNKPYQSTYCQKCGLMLPLRNLTIDHQKPQQGGDISKFQAMIRIFRALGLTCETGAGEKNRHIQSQFAASVGGDTILIPLNQKISEGNRYSLTDKGALYYSILKIFDQVNQMKLMAMNHVVNLRPMCAPCNSSLQNFNITWLD